MRRKLFLTAGALVALYLATALFGVPAVVRQFATLEADELRVALRVRGRGTPAEIEQIAEALRVRFKSVVAVFPGVVLVTYDSSLGKRGLPRETRAVLWYGFGSRFLKPRL